jgi:tetrapyrrole methylase family protein/MazG family protein
MSKRFDELVEIMARLRAPGGCPWDRKQTHESLKPYLLEEAYELLEAIDENNVPLLREEMGDLLLQVIFHSQIAGEAGTFTIDEVMQHLADKLVRRHPHVFGEAAEQDRARNADEVYARWEEIKRAERERTGERRSALDGVPKTLPALLRAFQVQARASRVGFDWPQMDEVLKKLDEELRELREAMASAEACGADPAANERVESELGDVLFTLVNLARFLKANPEDALRKTIDRFIQRFQFIEARAAETGRKLDDMSLSEMDALWDEAKKRTKA